MSDQILVEGLCSEQDMLIVGCSGLSTSHEVEKTTIDLHKEIVHGSFSVQVFEFPRLLLTCNVPLPRVFRAYRRR
jgi:hypothetical protein